MNLILLFTWLLLIIDFIWVWQRFTKLMSCHPFKFCRCRTSCNWQMQISTTHASSREWVPSNMGRTTIFRQFRWDSGPQTMHATVEDYGNSNLFNLDPLEFRIFLRSFLFIFKNTSFGRRAAISFFICQGWVWATLLSLIDVLGCL